jgi:hypothetical protein
VLMCDLKLRVTWIRDRRESYFEKKGQEISPGTIFPLMTMEYNHEKKLQESFMLTQKRIK